jgi:hypothetical protein
MTCPHCLSCFQIYKEYKFLNAAQKYMLKASCPVCNKYIKFLAFSESKTLSSEEIKDMYDHNYQKERGGF